MSLREGEKHGHGVSYISQPCETDSRHPCEALLTYVTQAITLTSLTCLRRNCVSIPQIKKLHQGKNATLVGLYWMRRTGMSKIVHEPAEVSDE